MTNVNTKTISNIENISVCHGNNKSILHNAGVTCHDCADCIGCDKATTIGGRVCKDFNFIEDTNISNEESSFYTKVLPYLRETTPQSDDKRMKVCAANSYGNRLITSSGSNSLYEYHVGFINSVLKTIREKRNIQNRTEDDYDYVFQLWQLKEILKYEPDVEVFLKEGIYYLSLPTQAQKK